MNTMYMAGAFSVHINWDLCVLVLPKVCYKSNLYSVYLCCIHGISPLICEYCMQFCCPIFATHSNIDIYLVEFLNGTVTLRTCILWKRFDAEKAIVNKGLFLGTLTKIHDDLKKRDYGQFP